MGWKMRFTYDKHEHPKLNANDQEGDVSRNLHHHRLTLLNRGIALRTYEEKPRRPMTYDFFFK